MRMPVFNPPRPLGYGPRQPMPFPKSGKGVKLITCPRCKLKHLPIYYAPKEVAYSTKCLNCGQVHLIKPRGIPIRDLLVERQKRGITGFHHEPLLRKKDFGRVTDATRLYEEARERQDLGYKRWWRK